jgi:hypothetical protein
VTQGAAFIPPQLKEPKRFSWRRAFVGAGIGLAVALVAQYVGHSVWWWLAVPFGLSLGGSSNNSSPPPPVLWGK